MLSFQPINPRKDSMKPTLTLTFDSDVELYAFVSRLAGAHGLAAQSTELSALGSRVAAAAPAVEVLKKEEPAAKPGKSAAKPGKSADTPTTAAAVEKPSASEASAAPKTPKPALNGAELEDKVTTLEEISAGIKAALDKGPQMRPKLVALLAEYETDDGKVVTNAKALQPKDYEEFALKLRVAVDPNSAQELT
jgi:hypothetical protein